MRRRDLLAAAAAPLGLAGDETTDARRFETALLLAEVTALAYRQGVGSGRLDRGLERVAARFAAQEDEHAAALRTAVEALGGTAPLRPTGVRGLDRVDDQAGFVDFAIGLERRAIAGYAAAVARLTDPGLLRTVASIMAADGQQLAVLRAQRGGPGPVTRAFETGER